MPSSRYRRQIIHSGVISLIGFAGCSLRTQSEIQLGGVRVENFTQQTQQVSITVRKNGTSVYDSTVDVEAASTTGDGENVFGTEFINCTWDPDDMEDFVVTAQHERTDETVRIGADDDLDGGCYWASVHVDSGLNAVWNECEPYDGAGHLCYE